MTKKQFLDAVNEIDDKFIYEIIDIPRDVSENYFADEQPQLVYLTSKPIPFWKIAVSTAAVMCVLAAGVFTVAKLRSVNITPNDSTTENSSYSQTESLEPDKFEMVLNEGIEFSYSTPNWYYSSDPIEKTDDKNYAVVYVACRNISEENQLFIAVKKYLDGNPVYIGTLWVTDDAPRTYHIDYTEEVKSGDELFLYISTKSNEVFRADGRWLP